MTTDLETAPPLDFIRARITDDIKKGLNDGQLATRFPPEPNGYLHIGHAKAICLNFGVAAEWPQGHCFLRMDDTNPEKEHMEYVQAIVDDVRWMGFEWVGEVRFASNYFERLYEFAQQLVVAGKAYVCSLSAAEIRRYRGTLTEPGRDSPYRNRNVDDNLDLFHRMRAGEFPNGTHVLRAKIDMASPNLNMRDPTLYRIKHSNHYRAGDEWCIYPMYDFTQCVSDAIEGVTHSLCTLEFQDHRPLYDWVLDELDEDFEPRPRQIEFSRLSLEYAVMSKRILTRLVADGLVAGWNDPRMPTISGLRRRGFTPRSIREFCARIGITKKDHMIEMSALENCIRGDLDQDAPRVMGVLRPVKVVILNYPEGGEEQLVAHNHPNRPELGTREVWFSREIFIEQEDFMENPPKKFFRLSPGREVRLRYAYLIRCEEVVRDVSTGRIEEIRCTYDPGSRGGNAPDGRKVKGTLHWVCARRSLQAEVRLYDRLFNVANPLLADGDLHEHLNPDSLESLQGCRVEAALANPDLETRYQFERQGYFIADGEDSRPDTPVFNRIVTLRDTWARLESERRRRGS